MCIAELIVYLPVSICQLLCYQVCFSKMVLDECNSRMIPCLENLLQISERESQFFAYVRREKCEHATTGKMDRGNVRDESRQPFNLALKDVRTSNETSNMERCQNIN